MLKRITFLLMLVSFISVSLVAQNKIAKPLKMDEPTAISKTTQNMGSPVTAADYVKVAVMPNAYGPASGDINPLAYDPVSNTVAAVYRWNGNGLGSGQLQWSYSTDGGATYTPSATTVQEGFITSFTARYPSMTLHNPDNSTDLSLLWAGFAWPDLFSGGTFDDIGYGVTLGMTEAGFAAINSEGPAFSSRMPTFSDGEYMYWVADNQDDDNIYLFKTADYATVEESAPWGFGGFPVGGVARDGKLYVGFLAPFAAEIGVGGWEVGYSVSEDQGATWSAEVVPDWTALEATANFTGIWDYDSTDGNIISPAADIQVDGNGYVHIVVGLEDSTKFGLGGAYAVVELFETADGWDSKIIAGDLDYVSSYNDAVSPGLGQTGYNPLIATNTAGDYFVATYIYAEAPDTLVDIYMVHRAEGGEWSEPINLTETPMMNENGSHLAPMLKDNGDGSYVAFSGYWYEDGQTGYATYSDVAPTAFYVAPVAILPSSVEGEEELSYSFDLQQNYPNPFNPSTTIKYSVPQLSDVSIKVYDVLGKEVATLIDAQQAQGVYEVNFDAANLASGMYIYTIQAGSFTSSKKMLLMK